MESIRLIPKLACLAVILLIPIGLIQAAQSAEEVNVYSYRQPFLIKPMFAAFTRETGIEVNTVFAKKGLVERLEQEGANSPADLVFTVDIGRLTDVYNAGLTAPIASEKLRRNIPSAYHGTDGHWFGLTSRVRIIVTSKERAPEISEMTYEELADPIYQRRICTRSGKHPYMVALIASMMVHHGEAKAEQWLSGLKNNLARKPQGNDRAQVKAIKEGVCDIAIINHYYLGKMFQNEEQTAWVDAVNILFPNQFDRGAHVNVSGVALAKQAPNRANAVKLIEFLSDDLAQQMYAEQNFEYPLKPGVPWSGLLRSLGSFKPDNLSLVSIAAQRASASKLVDKVDYNR